MMAQLKVRRSARLSAFRSVVRIALALGFGALHWFGSQRCAAQNNQDVRALEIDKPIELELTSSESHSYQFALAAGHLLRAVVEQCGIDVVVNIRAGW